MKNTREVTGVIEMFERLKNSTNGNPRYVVSIRETKPGARAGVRFEYHARTKVDSGFAYELPNLFGKEVVAVVGEHFGRIHIESAKKEGAA
jgi:hypothetical protein